MKINDDIKEILAKNPSYWIAREQFEEVGAAYQKFVETETAYCLACDGVHPGAYRERGLDGERPDPGETCNRPHISECTCEQCESERFEGWEGEREEIAWREHYHTFDEMETAPPVAFLIDGFLAVDAIAAIAAPVGQRKSLIALNVAHALCTKEPLFGHFAVTHQPTRVLYLCPEMGIRSFTERVRKIGLRYHVARNFFCRTMTAGTLSLDELTPRELAGAVVIIDTAVRYLKGDENKSEDMRAFAESIFRLIRDGAVSVLLLHHSAKGTKESNELTLENSMRGSGELGAFVTSCWATRLVDPEEPYKSASYLVNVKQRDFESQPFALTSGPDCRLHMVPDSLGTATLAKRSNPDAALAFMREHPELKSERDIQKALQAAGLGKSRDWIRTAKLTLLQEKDGRLDG